MQAKLMKGKTEKEQKGTSSERFFKSSFNLLIHTLVYFLLSLSLIRGSSGLVLIAVAVSCVYCAIAELGEIVYFLVGLSLFEAVFTVGGDNAWFALLLIFVARIFLWHLLRGRRTVAIVPAISFVILFALELLLDFFNGSMGQLLVNLVIIIFVFTVFSNIHLFFFDAFRIICSLSISFFAVLFYLLQMYGGFAKFLSLFMSASYVYRFGHAYGDTVGGAMAIPLYTSMIFAACLAFLLLAKQKRWYHTLFAIVSSLVAILFGVMTVSRSFYLGILVALIVMVIFKSSGKGYIKYALIAFLAVAFLFLLFSQSDFVTKILDNLKLRLDSGVEEGTGGRTDIWLSCLLYLFNHPLVLIFGLGMSNYPKIGASLGEAFSAGAHNLLLDFIMSFGIVGLALMLVLIISALRRVARNIKGFNKHSLIPLITYLLFAMTALRTPNLKTWMFMLAAIALIMALNERKTV